MPAQSSAVPGARAVDEQVDVRDLRGERRAGVDRAAEVVRGDPEPAAAVRGAEHGDGDRSAGDLDAGVRRPDGQVQLRERDGDERRVRQRERGDVDERLRDREVRRAGDEAGDGDRVDRAGDGERLDGQGLQVVRDAGDGRPVESGGGDAVEGAAGLVDEQIDIGDLRGERRPGVDRAAQVVRGDRDPAASVTRARSRRAARADDRDVDRAAVDRDADAVRADGQVQVPERDGGERRVDEAAEGDEAADDVEVGRAGDEAVDVDARQAARERQLRPVHRLQRRRDVRHGRPVHLGRRRAVLGAARAVDEERDVRHRRREDVPDGDRPAELARLDREPAARVGAARRGRCREDGDVDRAARQLDADPVGADVQRQLAERDRRQAGVRHRADVDEPPRDLEVRAAGDEVGDRDPVERAAEDEQAPVTSARSAGASSICDQSIGVASVVTPAST